MARLIIEHIEYRQTFDFKNHLDAIYRRMIKSRIHQNPL